MSATHTVMVVTFCVPCILYLGVLLCQCLWNLLMMIPSTCQFSQHNLKYRSGTNILLVKMKMLNSSEHLKYCSQKKNIMNSFESTAKKSLRTDMPRALCIGGVFMSMCERIVPRWSTVTWHATNGKRKWLFPCWFLEVIVSILGEWIKNKRNYAGHAYRRACMGNEPAIHLILLHFVLY